MSSEKRYGGAFAPKAADRMTAGVESVDMSKLWREKAQIKHLQEILNEASDPIDTRPGVYKSAALEGVDFSDSIDKACHRACPDLWDIYSRCKDKKVSPKNSRCHWRRSQHSRQACACFCARRIAEVARGVRGLVQGLHHLPRQVLIEADTEGDAGRHGR
jgi:hypothetical protein|eukprot:4906255-Prymnesium_polylepis.1